MRIFLVYAGILIAAFSSSLAKSRIGLRPRESLFKDSFFLKPWTTFDMMKRDFDDHFLQDPFFDDDDDDDEFEEFFHRPLVHSSSTRCTKGDKQDSTKDSHCKQAAKPKEKDLAIPQLAARVVRNDESQFKFAMNLKGFDRKEISVRVEDDFLKISGKKTCKGETKKCSERSFFRYQYLLPKHTDLSRVKASFSKDSFLVISVPKLSKIADASKGLQIEELGEDYVNKLNEELAKEDVGKDKAGQDDTGKEERKSPAPSSGSVDDDVTVESVPPTKS